MELVHQGGGAQPTAPLAPIGSLEVVGNSKRVVKILIGLLERGRRKVRLPGLVTSSNICSFSTGSSQGF